MAKTFFDSLNYTIGNEDSALEYGILPKDASHVVAIAGSGTRIIPLFAKNPRNLTCIDSSVEQLSLAELRVATLKTLNREEFLAFWGYPDHKMSAGDRKGVFNEIVISDRAKDVTSFLHEKNNWNSLLYTGKWEQTFKMLSKINRAIVGKKGLDIFSCRTKEDQLYYLEKQFPKRAWALSVYLLGNATIFNALLYKGNFPKKNISVPVHTHYMNAFNHLFDRYLVRENYFLQLLFFGKLKFSEGLPIECNKDIFLRAKRGAHNTLARFVHGDVIEKVRDVSKTVDFLSLSDIPSYFGPPKEQEFLQNIKDSLSTKGIVASRYYLRIPERLNTDGFKDITNNYKKLIAREKVQVYSFGVYQKA
jgi:S-adenosylmethionine-diacylglycerol 3-amino-3-carboxypropyl transferase